MHQQFVNLATRLIARNGRSLELQSRENTGTRIEPSFTTVSAAVIGVETQFKNMELDGDLRRSTDKLFLIDAKVRPELDMRLLDYGIGSDLIPLGEWEAGIDGFGEFAEFDQPIDYSIVSIHELKPGETAILYKVQARL